MDVEKRKKLGLVLLPIIALVGGVIIFKAGGSEEGTLIEDNGAFGDVEIADKSDELEKKTEVYQNYFDESDKKEWVNKSSNKQDFFSEDEIEVAVDEAPVEPEEKEIVEEKKPVTKIVYVEKKAEPKPEEKPKQRRRTRDDIYDDGIRADVLQEEVTPIDDVLSAVIHSDQEVKSGGRVTMRITKDAVIGGMAIPKNTFIYGVASFSGDRVFVMVNSIDVSGRKVTRSFIIYDGGDNMEGLFIPGGIQQESAKDAANTALQEIEPVVSIPILGSFPINVAKKKVDEPVVLLRSGHKIILK